MIRVKFLFRDGESVSDYDAKSFVERTIQHHKTTMNVTVDCSNAVVIHAFRRAIVFDEIKTNEIEFYLEDDNRVIRSNEYGVLSNPSFPPSVEMDLIEDILRQAAHKRKNK